MKQNLLPIYAIVGSDVLRRKSVLERLRVRLSQEEKISFNEERYDALQTSTTDVVQVCEMFPLGFDKRLVILEHLEALKKDDFEPLISYISAPNESTILILIADEMKKNTRIYKALNGLDTKTIIDCAPKKSYEMPEIVVKTARSFGLDITIPDAKYFIQATGVDTMRINEELKKLTSANLAGNKITKEVIDTYIAHTEVPKLWDLQDALAAKNAGQCIRVYQAMAPTVSVHALLPACVTRIRELLICKTLQERNEGQSLAGYLKVPDWRVKNHTRWASLWTKAQLRNALITAQKVSIASKSGSDAHVVFMRWLLDVIA